MSGHVILQDAFSSNNPASALVASSRSPIPLAPRLTTASTSQQLHLSGTHGTSTTTSIDGTHSPAHSRPRPLIHRASLSTATQALNVDTSPPSARFSAYLPRPYRHRWQTSSIGRSEAGHADVAARRRASSLAFGLDDSTLIYPQQKGKVDTTKQQIDTTSEAFKVLPQFRMNAHFAGDVLVRCSGSDFYVHRAVLYFASPFFQAVLDGDWKETHPSLHTLSDVEDGNDSTAFADDVEAETSSEGLSEEETTFKRNRSPRASFHTAHFTFDSQGSSTELNLTPSADVLQQDRRKSLGDEEEITGRLKRLATPPPSDAEMEASDKQSASALQHKKSQQRVARRQRKQKRNLVAVIDLSEEEASIFQDFLCLIYPNLDLLVTWYNIFALFAFSDKYEVPHLRRACTTFLRAALAGRPIEAMALAERHGLEDVYREASRHVLENMPSWEPEELDILSSETLLRLERKRTWFLERLLKLGLANPGRDYECHAACTDPQNCARLLHERWRNQYANAFKFGPPQPSVIWRHLRELEPNASLITAPAMSACQSSSKAWVQLLFDRMYGLPTHGMTHPKFLSIKLDPDNGPKPRPRPAESDMSLPS